MIEYLVATTLQDDVGPPPEAWSKRCERAADTFIEWYRRSDAPVWEVRDPAPAFASKQQRTLSPPTGREGSRLSQKRVCPEDGSVEDPRDDFDAFYREHVREVLGYLARATGRADTAAELTADTFAAALTSRRRFDPNLGSPRQWVFGIARHQLQKSTERGRADERLRRRLRIVMPPLDDGAAAAIERLAAADAGPALEELPALYREAVRARVVEERGYEEIARVQGVSQAAIRQRVARGLAALRGRIGKGP